MAERGTARRGSSDRSTSDVFARAQWRLALLFTGIVIILVVVSGIVMYLTFRSELRVAAARSFPEGETEQEYINRTLVNVRWQLLLVDGIIIAAVGAGGLLYARRTLRPIRENVAAQKRFIADASHDLRTPLTVMKTDFEVTLRDPALAPAARPALESGLEEVDRMSEMVEDLLTLSRIDAHQEQLVSERLDVTALVKGTTEQLARLAAMDDVRVVMGATGGGAIETDPILATGDGRHLRRALTNVVKNAIEHSPQGGVVEVAVGQADGMVEVVVTDQGPGIPPDEVERVFDRFYRSDPARSRERGGTGLGLAISRWALRQMHGDVTIRGDGDGSAVKLTLPAAS